ncbi:hypothetical protein QJ48_10475 [Paenibacillus sp. A3]|uniref:DUF3906 family protein n=1 Tax=Paenibacillus sp. A3 TaxID=1337054 RepID=UPI0006D5AA53|nr:DUF3906 family protein [Paenibacillus sp. A3]KPV59500.1 hypothetical protein QJ48_10475 [Paenibacillus sp. A3]
MYIYKLEVELQEQPIRVVVMAENDEQTFALLDELLARHFVRSPEVLGATIVEKKRAVKGAGYVIESKEQ